MSRVQGGEATASSSLPSLMFLCDFSDQSRAGKAVTIKIKPIQDKIIITVVYYANLAKHIGAEQQPQSPGLKAALNHRLIVRLNAV